MTLVPVGFCLQNHVLLDFLFMLYIQMFKLYRMNKNNENSASEHS